MSVKENAVVTVSYENGSLVLSDNEGNPFDPSNPEAFTTLVAPNGKIGWVAGEGISAITNIRIDTGAEIFKKLPAEEDGVWGAKLDNKQSLSSKYSIFYIHTGSEEEFVLDPILRLDP